jgi:ubiquinone/menaquinone biosynthesis C-methylase UbiE
MDLAWPEGFKRVPEDPWVSGPLETLALKYDTVETHGWYRNLEPTVDDLTAFLKDGHVLIDYSAGTGILVDRLIKRAPKLAAGMILVDASPKFLRLALEKLGKDGRVAFRWIRYLKEEKRLERLDEVVPPGFQADAIVSTNAIHLYYGLDETLRSWRKVLKKGGRAFIQSGNIRNPAAREGEWIIDETVDAIHAAAMEIVKAEERWTKYKDVANMAAYDDLRAKYFLPVRPLDYYIGALHAAEFKIHSLRKRTIEASVKEWYDFLAVYHEGVLGWVGGVEKIEGKAPADEAVKDRLALIRAAMERIFKGKDRFDCCWTYVTAE